MRYIFFILLILNLSDLQAQDTTARQKIAFINQKKSIIQECLEKGLFLVEQSYAVKDSSGQLYGKDDKDYFGIIYYVGVLAENKILIPNVSSDPGSLDAEFKPYASTYKSVPIMHCIRIINSKSYQKIEQELNIEATPYLPYKDSIESFHIQGYDELQDAKLLVIHSGITEEIKEASFQSSLINIDSIKWDSAGKGYIDKPIDVISRKIIGGALFDFTIKTGFIQAKLVALYYNDGQHWVLQSVASKNNLPLSTSRLTPVAPQHNSKSKKEDKTKKANKSKKKS